MKVIVIGCTHAGTAAVSNMKKQYPEAEITVYEKNDNVSFLSCGIALYVGGVVEKAESLFYSSPEQLADQGIHMKLKHEVTNIDRHGKEITVTDMKTGESFKDSYDKLVITTGSWPVVPPLEGIQLNNIQLCKNYSHAKTIIEKSKNAKNITVVGAGYIGIELVEAFEHYGKNVTLIDGEERILNKYLDPEYTNQIESTLAAKDITLALGQTVTRFEGTDGSVSKVITSKGEYEADLVILCIGFKPNTGLLKGEVNMLSNGAIIVDEYMRTSDESIFAAGDSCAIRYNPTKQPAYIPLATNAVRMGTLVAKNIMKPTVRYMGTQGTSGIKIYDLNIASTGVTETAASHLNMNVKSITIKENDKPEFMPEYNEIMLKVVYEEETNRIVGAQVMSETDVTQAVNTLSVCIQNEMTIDELGFVDFFFQPHYNKPWNFLNQAGLQAIG
ncbi:FAD-dependent oxidoreductase [Metabacillus sp. KIGAM252]|uniref:FAD-dependent oxidoreductase n=1 Tax=Metabacillus flavus TaxID=2823519 RepID=A0ABS5L9J7_9BACI|nr:FAD-dependent oxidoreductase [Metabacillus flavus]MBS2967406.1 FAD-dependent oxidoreductase [Metabacillus flavus]